MEVNKIIMIVAYAICAVDLALIPLRRSLVAKSLGKLEIKTTDKANVAKPIFTVVCCIILISILWFRKFDLFAVIVLCGCAVLGTELSVRDFSTFKRNGVYENSIVSEGQVIKFADILSFPLLNLSQEDFDNYNQSVLVIQTRNKGAKSIIFTTEEECKETAKKIQELHPQFKA